MNRIYKSPEGERLVRERYLAFLKHWPVAHQQIRIPTSQGETFAIAFGADDGKLLPRSRLLESLKTLTMSVDTNVVAASIIAQ
jgi:hypothetical protein